MKKILLLTLTLTACGTREPNLAKVMVMAQAPKASCTTARIKKTDIAVCEIPGKDKVNNFLAVYGKDLAQPFQVYPLDPQPKPEATPPPAPTPGEGSGANAPTSPATK